ncbi:MAG: nucleotidyltransferase family protein [SAR202 cluster bacterium]|nr:nucleotidyltransferase family protein [SAR202 cluster bacterium]
MQDSNTIRTALVLAGGKGERLRPLTDDRPKPMVPVGDRPLIEYHLRWLASNGVRRAILLVGYKQEVIRQHFAVERVPGLTVECVGEDRPLGRGGAIRNGFEVADVHDELIIATNGDVVSEQPIADMLALHRETNALVTVLLTRMVSPFGVVEVDDAQMITSFREKPVLSFWINGGAYVLSREALLRFPREGDHETLLFPDLARSGRIAGFKSEAYWKSVESAKDLRELADRTLSSQPSTPQR